MTIYVEPARFNTTNRMSGSKPTDVEHRRDNSDICKAIDVIGISCVLNRMVKAGRLTQQQADIFELQTGCLRAAICSENNRAHGL